MSLHTKLYCEQLSFLTERTGAHGFSMITPGHAGDLGAPSFGCSDELIKGFFPFAFHRSHLDILGLFELYVQALSPGMLPSSATHVYIAHSP